MKGGEEGGSTRAQKHLCGVSSQPLMCQPQQTRGLKSDLIPSAAG